MARFRCRQFGFLALLAVVNQGWAAENLPALKVDPSLLGLPPAAAKEVKPAAEAKKAEAPAAPTQAATEVAPTAPAVAATSPAEKAVPAAAVVTPVVAEKPVTKGEAAASTAQAAGNQQATPPKVAEKPSTPASPTPAVSVQPSSPPAVATAAAAIPAKPAVPVQAASPAPVVEGPNPRNMAVLKVDPALLGPAAPALAATGNRPVVGGTAGVASAGAAAASATAAIVGEAKNPVVIPLGRASDRKSAPVYVTADDIQGQTEVLTVAKGRVELVKADSRLHADMLTYSELEDEMEATGNVRLTREGEEMSGPHLKLRLGESVGAFDQPTYRIAQSPASGFNAGKPVAGYGNAEKLEFEGPDHYKLTDATYSTCRPGNDQDWFARVANLSLDYEANRGQAESATVFFKGVPILYAPSMSFALNNERKSGLLAPTLGGTTNAGFQYIQPYYLNIAPNMDATIAPRLMTKRGLQLQGEFRYLGQGYQGQMGAEYLAHDQISNTARNAFSILHIQNFTNRLSGSLNVSHVSDYDYFNDLSTQLSNIATTNLLRQGQLTYAGDWWNVGVLAQRYQTLQNPSLPVVVAPYARLPQVTLNAIRPDLPFGMQFNLQSEYVSFSNQDPAMVQARRTVVYPQLSLPFQTAAFYVTPKIGVHNTHYDLDNPGGTSSRISRNLSIFSVDSGLVFERDTSVFGKSMIQTVEPRIYYLRVPLRDQSAIPVFDTAVADFNFAQIFSENYFSGNDRIADANQLTGAVTSRLLNPVDGSEVAKVMLGQRWYFSDQSVTLPGVIPRSGHLADYLGAVTAPLAQNTYFDGAFQYNPRDKRMERFNSGVRYQPGLGKVLNVGYRYFRDSQTIGNPNALDQFDVSGQWPLSGGWSAVGRYNYSLREKRGVETVAGVEYNESCWAFRIVTQRVATAVSGVNSALFFQLELNGFSRIGSSPLQALKRNVPGYGRVTSALSDSDISE